MISFWKRNWISYGNTFTEIGSNPKSSCKLDLELAQKLES
ncbi:hypothetical protein SLEP1_g1968 [Rubroshorea leprosula]|uniref:Uncharacterized protein n=1 Tax=Rubroshorea leprosula TaxID=152421 RepID=A0AAV5HFL0_9ROSI|nr:hypothetical protein SLEP1_g1968 [Rubroshorea leprosula]